MSLSTFLDIAGLPGMDLAVTTVYELGKSVQNIKVYRTQCRDLSDRCTKLLLAFRDQCRGLEGSEFTAAADEVSNIVERAHKKAVLWGSWNRVKSLVNQNDIKQGLEQLYKDIDACAQRFNIAAAAGLQRSHRELQIIHERDTAQNLDMLRDILQSVDGLRDIISDQSAVRPIMQTIQEQLQEGSVPPEQSLELQQSLWEIHRRTKFLPPIIDLTGQIQRISKNAVAYGAYNDVFVGLWLGEEKVALKFARSLNHTEKARKRFLKEVEIWRELQHRHICRFYGIFYEEDQIYSVSPWMECGSALDYINSTEEVINRIAILGDVASGMEYLHGRSVVHGDLRAANVLIGDDGRACVSDFGLSRVLEEIAPDASSSTHGDSPVRWQAPELLEFDDYGSQIPVSPATDVWSYGMLCLENLSGKKPYHNRVRDPMVVAELLNRRLPDRPMDETVIRRGLDDRMWNLMLQCWSWEASHRPTMSTVKSRIRSLQPSTSHSANPILGVSISESPRHIAGDLPQVANLSSPIPIPNRTHPMGVGSSYRTPPSPSPLSQVLINNKTPPIGVLLGSSPPGHPVRRYSPSIASSSSSFSLHGTHTSPTSAPQIRHRPSVSSIPRRNSQSITTSSPALGVSIGVSPPKTRDGLAGPIGNTTRMPEVAREANPSNEEACSSSISTTTSNLEASYPLHNPLTSPIRTSHATAGLSPRKPSSASSSGGSFTFTSNLRPSGSIETSRPLDLAPTFAGLSVSDRTQTGPPSVTIEASKEPFRLPSIFGSQGFLLRSDSSDTEGLRDKDHKSFQRLDTGRLSQFQLRPDESVEGDPSGGSISSSFPSSVDSRFTHARSSSSIDAVPPRCNLLDFSGLDLSTQLINNMDGSIRAASLGGLVDHLLKEVSTVQTPGGTRKQKCLDAFLVTHTLFTSTTDVLRFLLYRFTMTDSALQIGTQERVDTKYRVLKFLGEWLMGPYARVLEIRHLDDLRLFLQDVNIFTNVARELISTVNHLTVSHPSRAASPTLSHAGSKRSTHVSAPTPTGLAVALSVYEGKKYRAITALDCVNYLLHNVEGSQSGSPNKVKEARETNNKIVQWVKKSILRPSTWENRQETLLFFVNTAAECRRLHNYSSMSAILAGIESPQVSHLKLTCRLKKPIRDMQKNLSAVLDIAHNHRAYRDALPIPGSTSCLPLLAIHLKDLQFVYERQPNRVQQGSETLINFEKFVRVHDSILSLLAYQTPLGGSDKAILNGDHGDHLDHFTSTVTVTVMEGERKSGPLLYLEEQLARVRLGRVADDAIEKRSRELQKDEDIDYEHRVPEFTAVGFRAPRSKR